MLLASQCTFWRCEVIKESRYCSAVLLKKALYLIYLLQKGLLRFIYCVLEDLLLEIHLRDVSEKIDLLNKDVSCLGDSCKKLLFCL